MEATKNGCCIAVQPETRNHVRNKVVFEINEYPEFNGDCDPMESMMWIDTMEAFFDAIDCSEEQKVVYAVTKLRSEALRWWKLAKVTSGSHTITKMTWSEFKELFKQEFRPIVKVLNIVGEYLDIKMGSGETEEQFMSRYDKYLWFLKCHVTPEEIKTCLFVWGFMDEGIRNCIIAEDNCITKEDMVSFEQSAWAALTIETWQNMLLKDKKLNERECR